MRPLVAVTRAMRAVSGGLLILVAGAIVTDVVVRYVTSRSVPGVIEYSELALVAIAYLAFANAEATGAHIRVDSMTRLMPRQLRVVAVLVSHLGVVAMLGYFTWVTGVKALESFQIGEVRLGAVYAPVWPGRAVIPLGYAALALMFLATTVDKVRRLVSDRPEAGAIGSETRITAVEV